MVLGLARPDSGRVSLFGVPPAAAIAAGLVGGMLQTGSLVEYLSVRELLTMVASLYPRPLAVGEALELSGTAAFADRRTNKLSGGQTQRVRFAIALVANTDLLVLDEPTAALDVESRREFWASMRAVAAGGKTVMFATHYLEEADAYADRIILLARGRVVADGSTTEIKAKVGGRTIRATLPGRRGGAARRPGRRCRRRPARRHRDPDLHRLGPRTPRPPLERSRPPTTSRCTAPASKRPSSPSPPTPRPPPPPPYDSLRQEV